MIRHGRRTRAIAFGLVLASGASAREQQLLPAAPAWTGSSERLVADPGDAWITPAEAAGFATTPSYDETVEWLRRLVAATSRLALVSLGRTGEGREILLVVATAEGASGPAAVRANRRPTLLVQAGIHAGEIDGKDAGLMLLRDLRSAPAEDPLRQANFLFVPILNPDGHERTRPGARINQRGPENAGWRTNARNLNLNRDYAKLDTPELRAVVGAIEDFAPDLYVDVHVTDGADYQYDITFGYNRAGTWSPASGHWLDEALRPRLERELREAGHIPGPLVFGVNGNDLKSGLGEWTASPRYSNGYGDARHLATVLVENHSLKPYRQRVLGTRVLLESLLRQVGRDAAALREATRADRERRTDPVPLDWRRAASADPPLVDVLAVRSETILSEIAGGPIVRWLGEPEVQRVPLLVTDEPSTEVRRPLAYWVPPAWPEVIERLARHGIRFETLAEPRTLDVEMYRLVDVALEVTPFEGRVRVKAGAVPERRVERFAAGAVRVPVDQPLGTLAMLLLEPLSPDSFFRWGFFLEVLQRTEYVESYVMEPLARRMLAEDPELGAEFRRRLTEDRAFAGNSDDRLEWFYRRTPYFDDRFQLYPVARQVE